MGERTMPIKCTVTGIRISALRRLVLVLCTSTGIYACIISFVATTCLAADSATGSECSSELGDEELPLLQGLYHDFTEQQIHEIARKPTDPVEFIKNMKFIANNNFLLQKYFFSRRNLCDFLGGSRILIATDKHSYAMWRILDVSDLFQNSRNFPGMGIDVLFRRMKGIGNETGAEKVSVTIIAETAHDTRLTAEVVESQYGEPGDIVDPYAHGIPGSTPLSKKTHPLGNLKLCYSYNSSSAVNCINFILSGDGTVNRIHVIVEEK
jgi:hypothetical protein